MQRLSQSLSIEMNSAGLRGLVLAFAASTAMAWNTEIQCFGDMLRHTSQCVSYGLTMSNCRYAGDPLVSCRDCTPCQQYMKRCMANRLRQPEFEQCSAHPTMMGMWR
ncbi:hypothetical protein CLF_107139 [Clonorchis sinensis]|uniref:Uncharacterized protein n=1 Tax=Clonorchis sinensis TaxID=79923 RepID=G7YG76_CLOSI|nr:hypothetical protein CLF_107139 [Clonorchis sinensis]